MEDTSTVEDGAVPRNPWHAVPPRKLNAIDSLRLIEHQLHVDDVMQLYPEFTSVQQVMRAIDLDAANALRDELEERARRAHEAALTQVRAAPRFPGTRQDTDLLREIFRLRARALSPQRRRVFELCIEQGLTLAQCAAALGIGRETVRTHLRRLRALAPAAWGRVRR